MAKTIEDIQYFHEKLKFKPGQVLGNYLAYMNALQLMPSQFAYVVSVAEGTVKAHRGFDSVLGYRGEEVNLIFLYSLFHPDEKEFMQEFATEAFKYVLSFPSFPFIYEASVDYRVKKADGNYIRVLRQSTTLESDVKGKTISTISICTDISFLKLEGPITYRMNFVADTKFSLQNRKNGKVVHLSPRELEIIKLIALGNDSKKIAGILNLSTHTVRTHRRNILKRTKLESMVQLVNYAIKNSLI